MLSAQHQYYYTESRNGQQPSFAVAPSIHTPQRGATKAAHGELAEVLGKGSFGIACKFIQASKPNKHTSAYNATFEFNMRAAENYAIKIIRPPYPALTYGLDKNETAQQFMSRFGRSGDRIKHESESTYLRLKDLRQLQKEEYYLKKYHFGNASNIGIFVGTPSSTISFDLVNRIANIYYRPAIALSAPLAQGISIHDLTYKALKNTALSLGVYFHILKNIASAFKNIHTNKHMQFAHLDASTANYMVNLEKNCQIKLIDFGMAENLHTPTGEKTKISQIPTDPKDIGTYIFHRTPRFQEYDEEVKPPLVEIGPEDDAFAVARGIKDLCGRYLEQDNNSQYTWLNSLSKLLEIFMAKLNQIHEIRDGHVYPATMDNPMDVLLSIILLTETLEALSGKQNLSFDTNKIEERETQLETAEKQLTLVTSALGTSPEDKDTIQISKKLGTIKKDLALIKKIKQSNQEPEDTLAHIEPSKSPDTVASGIQSPPLPELRRSLSPTFKDRNQHSRNKKNGPNLEELRKELCASDSLDSLAYSPMSANESEQQHNNGSELTKHMTKPNIGTSLDSLAYSDTSASVLTNSRESLFSAPETPTPKQQAAAEAQPRSYQFGNPTHKLLGDKPGKIPPKAFKQMMFMWPDENIENQDKNTLNTRKLVAGY